MNDQTQLQSLMSGSKALQNLREKTPECPECGEKSDLYMPGIYSHEYKCRGEGHEFTVDTTELLSEEELQDLLLYRIAQTNSIKEVQELVADNFELKVAHICDPEGNAQWIERNKTMYPVQNYLKIHTEGIPELTQAIKENPNLDYHIEDVMKVVEKQKEVA